MTIIDLMIENVRAHKKEQKSRSAGTEIRVSNNSKIQKIEKKELEGVGDSIVVHFEFITNYTPDVGEISIGGKLIYYDKNLKDKIKEEKGNIVIKDIETFQEVQNFILRASTLEAILIAKELRMPSPIQLPSVRVGDAKEILQEDKKGYA